MIDDCPLILKKYCENYDKTEAKLAFFFEDIQYKTFSGMCKGAAIKLKNFDLIPATAILATFGSSFIHEALTEILNKIIPAGIPQYLYEFHTEMVFKKYEPIVDKRPKVLTIHDLTFGFVLWLAACGISITGFLLEILRLKLRKILRKLIGLWGVLRIFKWRLKNVVL